MHWARTTHPWPHSASAGAAVFMASFFKPPRFLLRDRAAPRARQPQSHQITCYRCAKNATVSEFAESASCPHCQGNLQLKPIIINKGHWGHPIMSTQSIHVGPKGKIVTNLILTSGDILIEGIVEGMCISGQSVRVTPTGQIKGGIRAAKLIIEEGANIEGIIIETTKHALGSLDIDSACRSRPGTGPASQIEFKSTSSKPHDDHPANQPIPIYPVQPPKLRVVH